MIIKYLMYYYYIIHICYLDINLSSNKFIINIRFYNRNNNKQNNNIVNYYNKYNQFHKLNH